MLIKEKIGNLSSFPAGDKLIDYLPLEWYEVNKRILHKKTVGGKPVVLKFLKEAQSLQQDDVVYTDDVTVIAIDILPCDVMVLQPAGLHQMAMACYEIGNKHLPLYYEDGCLLMPYDVPVYKMLQASGFVLTLEQRRLLYPLKTSVAPHGHGGESLFSRILKLTTSE